MLVLPISIARSIVSLFNLLQESRHQRQSADVLPARPLKSARRLYLSLWLSRSECGRSFRLEPFSHGTQKGLPSAAQENQNPPLRVLHSTCRGPESIAAQTLRG